MGKMIKPIYSDVPSIRHSGSLLQFLVAFFNSRINIRGQKTSCCGRVTNTPRPRWDNLKNLTLFYRMAEAIKAFYRNSINFFMELKDCQEKDLTFFQKIYKLFSCGLRV